MSNEKETGGPAFPVVDYKRPDGVGAHIMTITGGMTLRDHFAGLAMQAILTATPGANASFEQYAETAYLMADAMLEARK